METKKRAGNLSQEQKTCLIESLENDKELLQSKFSSTFTFKESRRRWTALAEKLNALPGARKNWAQFKRVSS